MKVAVVGPCASGKTLLVGALVDRGYDAYSVSQEHSGVRRLFRCHEPDAVVFLDTSYGAIVARRQVSWGPEALASQMARLGWARREADIVVCTDDKDPREVLEEVMAALERLTLPDPALPGDSTPV